MFRISLISCILLTLSGFAQRYPSAVVEYRPAPGQHINTTYWGCQKAAESLTTDDGHISLGAFGGSVTVRFSPAIENHPQNEYGVDFVVLGNPQPFWCEGGAVQVMCDRNGNGLPDDTWYQLATSQHFFKSAIVDTFIYNNPFSPAFPVTWTDANGETGSVSNISGRANEFYPQADLFPQIVADGAQYSGWKYQPKIKIATGSVRSYNPAFGFADNHIVNRNAPLTQPDNPYTPALEGCGGDSFDISWAVDDAGNYVHLDSVHFVRIYNSYQAMGGWLGELSPDITSIYALSPVENPVLASNILVLDWLPDAVLTGAQLQIDPAYFKAGQYVKDHKFTFEISDTEILSIDENFTLHALAQESARITVRSAENAQDSATVKITVQTPSQLRLAETKQLFAGDTVLLSAQIIDIHDQVLDFLPVSFLLDVPEAKFFADANGRTFFTADIAGTYVLHASGAGLAQDFEIHVSTSDVSPRVSVSFYDGSSQIVASQKYSFRSFSLGDYVTGAYANDSLLSVAHALAFPFGNVSFASDLRFASSPAGISIKSVPVNTDGSVHYFAGTTAKQWVVVAGTKCYTAGLDSISLNENMDISAILTGEKTSFTSLSVLHETDSEIELLLVQNELTLTGSTCSLAQKPIAGERIESNELSSLTNEFGIATFAKSATDGHTFQYGQIVAADRLLATDKLDIGTEKNIRTTDWSQYEYFQIFATDGRKIFDTATNPNALPSEAMFPACFIVRGQLRTGQNIIEQICN